MSTTDTNHALTMEMTGITTGAVTLHVEEEGTGAPALVFLHYWGGSARTWTAVMDRLASTNRCVAIEPVSLLAEHVVARIAGAALEVISDDLATGRAHRDEQAPRFRGQRAAWCARR